MRELGVGEIASLCRAATTRWTATIAGSASSAPIARWCTGKARRARTIRWRRCARVYEQGITDEFIEPIVITTGSERGKPRSATIRDDDAVIFFNFRADRARQLTYAAWPSRASTNSRTPRRPKNLFFVAMTQYDKTFPGCHLFSRRKSWSNSGASVRASWITATFACAETEKYAHVTYFFNGGIGEAISPAKSAFWCPRRKWRPMT